MDDTCLSELAVEVAAVVRVEECLLLILKWIAEIDRQDRVFLGMSARDVECHDGERPVEIALDLDRKSVV